MSALSGDAQKKTHPTIGLIILLGSLSMFGPLAIDMYLPGLPAIAADLGTDAAGTQLTLAAFFIGLALGQLVYGPLSDRIGRRPPVMIGVAFYVFVSIACAFATSIEALIVLRFIQALGCSAGVVVARAAVADLFERSEAAKVYSMLALVFGVAPILAPLLGGWILLIADWQAIFHALAFFGFAVLVASWMHLEESRSEQTAERSRRESPLSAYIAVLRQRRILGYMLAGSFGGSCMFIYIAASPDLLIGTYGIAPENYGWLFGINAVGFVAASQINRHLLARHTVHVLLNRALAGALLLAFALLVIALSGIGGLAAILPPLFLLIASMGFIMANGVAGAMSVDLERSGTTGALVGALQFVVGALGAVALGIFHDGSAVPMAGTMVVMLSAALIFLRALIGKPDPRATE